MHKNNKVLPRSGQTFGGFQNSALLLNVQAPTQYARLETGDICVHNTATGFESYVSLAEFADALGGGAAITQAQIAPYLNHLYIVHQGKEEQEDPALQRREQLIKLKDWYGTIPLKDVDATVMQNVSTKIASTTPGDDVFLAIGFDTTTNTHYITTSEDTNAVVTLYDIMIVDVVETFEPVGKPDGTTWYVVTISC